MRDQLFPFTQTRAVLDLRVGILTLREKWTMLGITNSNSADNSSGQLTDIPENLNIYGLAAMGLVRRRK